MKALGIIIMLSITTVLYGQQRDETYHWLEACDSLFTQADLNNCTYNEFKKADSLMTSVYNNLISLIGESIKEIESKDFPDKEYKDWYSRLRNSIITSQEQWVKLRDSNSNIINIQYEDGSMRRMAINISATDDTYIRIKKLKEIMYMINK